MSIIDKIKKQEPTRRRAIVLAILAVLALPLLWVVFNNFQARANILRQNQEAGLNNLSLPELPLETTQDWENVQQDKENADQFYSDMAALRDASSSSTSTPTTTNEYNVDEQIINAPEGY
ncbi:hypothetical protein COX74_03080 [bacterium (Candidatus Gribaldobacteria) CG_4_10_14_0_2_um_filter_41_16]|uniref:Uncharacterized protein n=4 Tax=Candidatus Gribaldobacteria TaxID=2798536 RepID=A0A2M7VHQ1_9BACT|nr:MAG: hypothetical protein AUJ36_03715 [Parcubacteria group bacterium CG1_02_41_26]PIR91030.1 MAG: hypothetical protein COU03_03330 [bacterium (Candidatus Gribaldobacteria) CG10_big_fil_rev_8_21_14_0_10_41_12]PIV46940.1 MAG: hypothetical protein COS21_02705 [bacterium (Candidatus Gribaldobacteria) CG02_land_8_20_14_3_00_41_15]PJA01371.1 MAG: hypothetical protein COX74_03080 [bacterium (Candidatus Gribaldobacteria) CG_4_10_14_0_2_um_filter_41_16]